MATEANPGSVRRGGLMRAGLLGLVCAFILGVHLKTVSDQAGVVKSYQAAAAASADLDARHVQDALQQVYQTLRVIAGIPGVRATDRHADNLAMSERATISRMYDNLYDAIRLTEIYVVPRDFQPDRIDPDSGAAEAPDVSFDSNVAGTPDATGAVRYPEVEVHEYHQMQNDLIPWLAAHYPNLADIQRLKLPMISSREVITCDNTEYNRTQRDPDRSGVVFAVPFYGPDGRFKGIITAIVRSNVLRALLPDHDAALVEPRHGYVVTARTPGQAAASAGAVAQGIADRNLIFSRAIRLDLPDPRSGWVFWTGHADAALFASPEYRATWEFALVADAVALLGAVLGWVIIGERRAFETKLAQRAFHDALTGLPNRLLLQDRLHQALIRARRSRRSVGVMFIDLDNFKLVNDSLGHAVGDELLVTAADRLRACVRAVDTVARMGGDEFVVVLHDLRNEDDALLVGDLIMQRFSEPFALGGHALTITVSIGIAVAEAGVGEAETLLTQADLAMYRAKTGGKGRCVAYDASMTQDGLERLELETDLRAALANNELRVFYQPIVLLKPQRYSEVEALVRWQHPRRGLVQPGDFIPLAERTGLIVPMGEWVLREACRQVATWHKQFPSDPPLAVSVNLSAVQVLVPDLVDTVAAILRETGLPPACLKLEITESVVMSDARATIRVLEQLKQLEVKLAIDDFGTGYSSLAYLRRLPVDVLKIDRSFVSGVGRGDGDDAIVRSVISLAKSLSLTVTGEGIETVEQSARLIALGCDNGQGYYFGRPADAASTGERLSKSAAAQAVLSAAE